MLLMRKTGRGTISASHESAGVSVGLYGCPSVASLECTEDGRLVLLINDDNLDRYGVELVHTNGNWVAKEN